MKKQKGFSIIELVCIIFILAIMSGTLWKVSDISERIPAEQEIWRDVERYSLACRFYHLKGGRFPEGTNISEELTTAKLYLKIPERTGYNIRFHLDHVNAIVTVYVPNDVTNLVADGTAFPLYDSADPGNISNDEIKEKVKRDWKGNFMRISADGMTGI